MLRSSCSGQPRGIAVGRRTSSGMSGRSSGPTAAMCGGRRLDSNGVRTEPASRDAVCELEDLVAQNTSLIAIVDHQDSDALVDVDQVEAKVWDPFQAESPIFTKRLLATHDSVSPKQACGYRRDELDVVAEMSEHRLYVVVVPSGQPRAHERIRVDFRHGGKSGIRQTPAYRHDRRQKRTLGGHIIAVGNRGPVVGDRAYNMLLFDSREAAELRAEDVCGSTANQAVAGLVPERVTGRGGRRARLISSIVHG